MWTQNKQPTKTKIDLMTVVTINEDMFVKFLCRVGVFVRDPFVYFSFKVVSKPSVV